MGGKFRFVVFEGFGLVVGGFEPFGFAEGVGLLGGGIIEWVINIVAIIHENFK